MRGVPSIDPSAAASDAPVAGWQVRPAQLADVPAVAACVRELLSELGGEPDATPAVEDAVRELLETPDAGALLLAHDGDQVVGVLAASWQLAIHVPGRYALVQDLWVHPARRGEAIGRGLLQSLLALAAELELARVEVGLPSERFSGLAATEAFYLGNGFTPIGPRMRLVLR